MKKKESAIQSTTFDFGNYKLNILNQKDELIPLSAETIHLQEQHAEAMALSVLHDLPTLLIGETGTGKTSVVRYLAFMRKQGYTRINMHGYNTPDELIGSKSVKDGATYYENGILTNAMLKGHIVVLDEINATPPDCTFIIHGLLDDDKRVALPNGDVIRPHQDFRFYATMNPDYEGTRTLNRAFMDRFAIVLNVDILPPTEEVKLLEERTKVKNDIADKMVKVAWLGRKAYRENKTMTMISTRTLLQWAGLMQQGVKEDHAYEIAVTNKAHKEEKEAFQDFFKIVFDTQNDPAKQRQIIHFITRGELEDFQRDLKNAKAAIQKKDQDLVQAQNELQKERSNKPSFSQDTFDDMQKRVKEYENLFAEMQKKISF